MIQMPSNTIVAVPKQQNEFQPSLQGIHFNLPRLYRTRLHQPPPSQHPISTSPYQQHHAQLRNTDICSRRKECKIEEEQARRIAKHWLPTLFVVNLYSSMIVLCKMILNDHYSAEFQHRNGIHEEGERAEIAGEFPKRRVQFVCGSCQLGLGGVPQGQGEEGMRGKRQ